MIKSESSISISATFNNQNEGRGGRIIVFVLNLSIAKLNTSNYLFRDLKLCRAISKYSTVFVIL